MIKRSKIVKMAREWLGVPYRHQGRTRLGVDGAGPLVHIAKEVGLGDKFDDRLIYSANPETFSLKPQMNSVLNKIASEEIKPGDLLLFRFSIHPQHVAIAVDYYTGGLGMLHCYSKVGKVVEHRLANVWMARLVQAYRIPGIEEDL